MFISIRWKAVIFLSFILLLIALAWVFQSIYQNINTYQFDIEQNQERQQKILDQLLSDNYLKLSQNAQLIIDNPQIKSYQKQQIANFDAETEKKQLQEKNDQQSNNNFPVLENNQSPDELFKANSINQYLNAQWYSWNLNISIDYAAVLNSEGKIIGEANQTFTDSEIESLRKSTQLFIRQAKTEPQNFIFCENSCIQFVMEPFFFANGELGILTLGQNMSDLIARYHAVSASDLAVLIELNEKGEQFNVLKNWNVSVWAISRFSELFDYVKNFSQSNALLEFPKITIWNLWDTDYFMSNMVPSNYIQVGSPAYFMSIINESKRQEQLKVEIWRGVSTSLVGWILAELLLIFLMMGPIQRLVKIVKALELLPRHHYQQAIHLVQANSKGARDEITQLEESTVYLANELETLHKTVELSEEKLKNQISLLTRSKEFLQRLFDNANLYIVTQSFEFETKNHNHLFSDSFDVNESSSFIDLFVSDYDRQTFKDGVLQLKAGDVDAFQQEVKVKNAKEAKQILAWTHTLVKDDQGMDQILSIGMDVTQRKKDELALNWLANNDSLTKIGNRRAFKIDLDKTLAQNQEGAVIFIDVNRFKQINDIYGHLAGDSVLMDIANQLKTHTRSQDSICRLAGDEFTIIMPGVSSQSLPNILDNLSEQLNRKITLSDKRVVDYSVSLGGAKFPEHGNDEQTLIIHSDMAMYKAKKKGLKNWHIFSYEDDQLSDLKYEHKIMETLKTAINSDGLIMNYQPILSIKDKKVSHYESLIRLKTPDGTSVSPEVFIPIAEKVGLIRDIDAWVIEHVLQFMAEALKTDSNLCFSINVSAPTLQDSFFSDRLAQQISDHDLSPESLIIELTETAYIENFEQVLQNLQALSKFGVAIALDDFGVGYSSFSYMKKLPLKYVKLDGSYIRNLSEANENIAFIRSVVLMAEAFGMQTIAEFVENQPDFDTLIELNVDFAQGYLIGKPRPHLINNEPPQLFSA